MTINKPVRCRCGGEAKIRLFVRLDDKTDYIVQCDKCGIATLIKPFESEAIVAWNLVMDERKAKVKNYGHPCGAYGYCSKCGQYCVNEDPYCPGCGARLEWE